MIKDCLKKKVATEVSGMVTDVYLNDGVKAENVRTATDDSNIATVKFGVPKKISLKCDLGAYDKAEKGGSRVDWCVLMEKKDEVDFNADNVLANLKKPSNLIKTSEPKATSKPDENLFFKFQSKEQNYEYFNLKEDTEYVLMASGKASASGPTQIMLENPPELSFKQALTFDSTESEIKYITFKTPKYANGIDEVNRIKIMSDEDVLIDSELYFKVQSETDFSYRIEVNGK